MGIIMIPFMQRWIFRGYNREESLSYNSAKEAFLKYGALEDFPHFCLCHDMDLQRKCRIFRQGHTGEYLSQD